MEAPDKKSTGPTAADRHFRVFLVCGALLWGLSLGLAMFSQSFAYDRLPEGRPHRTFVTLMTVAFVVQLIGLRAAILLKGHPSVWKLVLVIGVGCRLLLLPSHLIQEVDIYRYIWDGAVLADGGNPFEYSPRDVVEAQAPTGDEKLDALCALRDSSASLATSVRRVHYGHLTTLYPPVSQVVFAAAALTTPDSASVAVRRAVMKSWIVLFDVLTILGVLCLLYLLRMPPGWSVCYAWSPLVLKEFANSGHLDAIAICLCTWSAVSWILALQRGSNSRLLTAAFLLAAAVGAKIYPVVIVPVIIVSVWKRFGFQEVLKSGVVFGGTCALLLAPLVTTEPRAAAEITPPAEEVLPVTPPVQVVESSDPVPELPPDFAEVIATAPAPQPVKAAPRARRKEDTDDGFSAFFSRWRMNDLIFLCVHENLLAKSGAWFDVLPESARKPLVERAATQLGIGGYEAAFVVARATTVLLHLGIVSWLAWCAWSASPRRLLALAFYSVAWFWFLLPTQNPWYWIWAMPLLPFARQSGWHLVAGLSVMYYLRFWLENDLGQQFILETGYRGANFFHLIVVWFEHLPVLLLLACEFVLSRRAVTVFTPRTLLRTVNHRVRRAGGAG